MFASAISLELLSLFKFRPLIKSLNLLQFFANPAIFTISSSDSWVEYLEDVLVYSFISSIFSFFGEFTNGSQMALTSSGENEFIFNGDSNHLFPVTVKYLPLE